MFSGASQSQACSPCLILSGEPQYKLLVSIALPGCNPRAPAECPEWPAVHPLAAPGEEFIPKDKDGEVIFDTVDLCATWEAMEKCKDLGLTKSIGVSNFSRRHLERILNKPGLKYKPVCNQVECHPYLNQSKLQEFCKSKDIILTAYGALGTDFRKEWVNKNCPVLLKDPVLNAIAAKHGRTPAQVALRFQLQRGLVALVKSFNEKRIRENFQVFNFQLTPEDMESLDGLNKNIRYFPYEFVNHTDYPFFDEN
ncbi:aldo-keto reductase family 1 member C4 isoform X3 [Neovison vison]|uniref:aldo-keto reductase family 1 member C4 isoform X3 n=1 Tax=Neovison vison TaxID=452646 RepID=UPI001CF007F7|nr:aldo-keto reductase family 1 member C4 isoform X3 [Neogale vison]